SCERPGLGLLALARRAGPKKVGDRSVQKIAVLRTRASTRRMSPERRNGHESHVRNELLLIASVAQREVQVGLAGHVEEGHLNRTQRALDIATEAGRLPDVVLLPRASLQNEIVRVGTGDEVRAEVLHVLLERGA